MAKRTLPHLTLPSLLSDLSSLSHQPSLLPSLPPPAPSSPPDADSPSALAVQVAEEFIKSSNVLLDKVEAEVVEGLRERIESVESGVREVQGGLEAPAE